MPSRWLRVALLAALPAGGVAAAVHWSAGGMFVVVAAAYVVGHMVTIPNPSGRPVALTPGIAAVTALLYQGSPVMVIGAAAVAVPFGWLMVHVRHGRRATDRMFPAEPAGLAVFGAIFAAGSVALPGNLIGVSRGILVFVVAAPAWFVTAAAARALFSEEGRVSPRRLVLVRGLEDWPAYLALFSSAALYAITVDSMGPWAIPLAGLPYAFSHVSLHRVQTTQRTYRQTIRALGQIPEVGGLVAAGHAERVADLSVAVGAELGLSGRAVQRLEFAALLHDIGRVVLANPAIAAGHSLSDVSGWSAAIISEARYLEPVAEVVAAQQQPYRRPGQLRDPDLSPASKILRVVAGYDGELNNGMAPLESIEQLHRGAAYDYDPEVVMALRRVLERRRVIPG